MDAKPLALIIEDNEDQNLIFTTALNKAGYETESILDGTLAMNRLTKVAPAMIVLDLHVPGVDGGQILRKIRKDSGTQKANVIIVSADAEFAASLQTQADLVLLKPISFSQLSLLATRFINSTHALERPYTVLLDQSEVELGQLRLKEAEFSPQDLVQGVYSNNLWLALQKGLAMNVEVDSALPKLIIGDKTRIEQILSNLVVNAVKYTQTGSILIRANKNGAVQWFLQVKDSGVGISKGDQAFIFEPFRQPDETMGRGYGGVGLGLAIVHQLVMLMNGSVSVESELGRGSTFTVALPLRTA